MAIDTAAQAPPAGPPPPPPPSPRDAIITYQTLRIGMIAVVLMLFAAVLAEALRQGLRFESSISAYWYTPVRPVFVGALVAIGVALIVIKGKPWEDTFLNFAGALAPVVAFVPTLLPGEANLTDPDVLLHVANSMTALFTAGGAGIVVALYLRRRARLPREGGPEWWRLGGTIAIYLIGLVLFVGFRGTFTGRAHGLAAGLMFAAIAAAVWRAAFNEELRYPWLRGIYIVLAVAMAGTLVVTAAILRSDLAFTYTIMIAELVEIGAFVLFWGLQTYEHWQETVEAAREGEHERVDATHDGEAA